MGRRRRPKTIARKVVKELVKEARTMRKPMLEHVSDGETNVLDGCPACGGYLEIFLAGVIRAYDNEPLERAFLLAIESSLKDRLVDVFGFCRKHAEEVWSRLHEHAEGGKHPIPTASPIVVNSKGGTS